MLCSSLPAHRGRRLRIAASDDEQFTFHDAQDGGTV